MASWGVTVGEGLREDPWGEERVGSPSFLGAWGRAWNMADASPVEKAKLQGIQPQEILCLESESKVRVVAVWFF